MFEGLRDLIDGIMHRDLKYWYAGAIPLGLAVQLDGRVDLLHMPGSGWVIFLSVSYFLGIALFHVAMSIPCKKCPFIRMFPKGRTYEREEARYVILRIRAKGRVGDLRPLERVNYVKEMLAAIEVAFASCLIVLAAYSTQKQWPTEWVAAYVSYILAAIVGVASIVYSCKQNRSKAKIQSLVIKRIEGDLKKKEY